MKLLFDAMLKRTAKWCRIFGIDSLYYPEKSDSELMKIASSGNRVLVTCDMELAERCMFSSIPVVLIKEKRLEDRISDIACMTGAELTFPEKTRCPSCNGNLLTKKPGEIKEISEGRITDNLIERQEFFWVCDNCGKIYWKGSHWKNITSIFEKVVSNLEKCRV